MILKVCFSISALHTSLTVTTMSLYLLQLPIKALTLADYLRHDSWQSINQLRDIIDSNKVSLLNEIENIRRERKPSHKRQSLSRKVMHIMHTVCKVIYVAFQTRDGDMASLVMKTSPSHHLCHQGKTSVTSRQTNLTSWLVVRHLSGMTKH